MKFNNTQKTKLTAYRKLCDQWKKLNADILILEEDLGFPDDKSEVQVTSFLYIKYGLGDISLDQLERSLTVLENATMEPSPKKKKVARKMIKTPLSNSVQYLGNV
jgi:hypothetical protein